MLPPFAVAPKADRHAIGAVLGGVALVFYTALAVLRPDDCDERRE